MLELIDILLLITFFGLGLFFMMFEKEMLSKSKRKEFISDAVDGIDNKFKSNNVYSYSDTNGIAFYKEPDGKIKGFSQSKLCGISINY